MGGGVRGISDNLYLSFTGAKDAVKKDLQAFIGRSFIFIYIFNHK